VLTAPGLTTEKRGRRGSSLGGKEKGKEKVYVVPALSRREDDGVAAWRGGRKKRTCRLKKMQQSLSTTKKKRCMLGAALEVAPPKEKGEKKAAEEGRTKSYYKKLHHVLPRHTKTRGNPSLLSSGDAWEKGDIQFGMRTVRVDRRLPQRILPAGRRRVKESDLVDHAGVVKKKKNRDTAREKEKQGGNGVKEKCLS